MYDVTVLTWLRMFRFQPRALEKQAGRDRAKPVHSGLFWVNLIGKHGYLKVADELLQLHKRKKKQKLIIEKKIEEKLWRELFLIKYAENISKAFQNKQKMASRQCTYDTRNNDGFYWPVNLLHFQTKYANTCMIEVVQRNAILLFDFAGFVRDKGHVVIKELSERHEHGGEAAHISHVLGCYLKQVPGHLVGRGIAVRPAFQGVVPFLVNIEW